MFHITTEHVVTAIEMTHDVNESFIDLCPRKEYIAHLQASFFIAKITA